MTLPTNLGELEIISQVVVPLNTGTWSDLSGTTWNDFGKWIMKPTDLKWALPIVDLGRKTYFNLKIECQAEGDATFVVYTSEISDFNGEETITTIDPEDTDIPAFYGQYYCIGVEIPAGVGQLNVINSIQITVTTETFSISRSGVDTTTLSGSASSRTIALDRNVSHIWSLDIKATGSNHTLEWYVTDHPTSNTLIPVVNAKTRTGPTFKLIGLDNVARNGTIDYEIVAMPEQRRDGNNLILV